MAVKSSKHGRKKRKTKKKPIPIPENQYREIIWIFLWIISLFFLFAISWSAWILWNYVNLFLSSIFWIWAYLIPFILILIGTSYFLLENFKLTFHRVLWIMIMLSSILTIIHLWVDYDNSYEQLKEYWWVIWFIFSYIFRNFIWEVFSWIICFWWILVSIPLITNLSFKEMYQKIFKKLTEVREFDWDILNYEDAEVTNSMNIVKPELLANWDLQLKKAKQPKLKNPTEEVSQWVLKIEKAIPTIVEEVVTRKPKKREWWIKISNFTWDENWEFPSIDLLENKYSNVYPNDKELEKQASNIQQKLAQFWIEVEVVEARVWPTVTQFTLNPAEWVKVSKILSLKDDLALALSARAVRIEAPIPGQPYVWIEIPNKDRATVYMREIVETDEFKKITSKMALAVWKDVAWNPVVEDLAKMPHLLIAWATWSWKSVWMNTFLISLLFQNSPKELKFIMIDPKRVELWPYNWIPHLLTPVITEADKALSALKWSVSEMMRRYTECQEKWYRNIAEYNEWEEKKMPRIVIVIDELADLMMREFKKETEAAICRLAQMARAVWMHLIVATQRPSVDVITWLIKANIPTRASFTVTSSIDSRTILDSIWAEELLWMWDMMYIDPWLSKPKRIQWIYISSKEIERITNHIKTMVEPEDDDMEDLSMSTEDPKAIKIWAIDFDAIASASKEDVKVWEAIAVIQRTWKASATLLQRMIWVWYARAAKILDILEEKWMVWPANWAKPREVFLDRDEDV